ncbi:MAG: rubredoxin-like domain-containing protein [Promethearchaeota archaeon]
MNFKCTGCGYEVELDDFPDEGFACPGCGSTEVEFDIVG